MKGAIGDRTRFQVPISEESDEISERFKNSKSLEDSENCEFEKLVERGRRGNL